jgi:hypothetical protein
MAGRILWAAESSYARGSASKKRATDEHVPKTRDDPEAPARDARSVGMSSKRFDPSDPASRREVADRLTARIREILEVFDDPRKREIDEILREGRDRRRRAARQAPRSSVPVGSVALVFFAWYWFAMGQQSTGYRPDATATTRARQEAKIIRNAVDDHDPADSFEGRVRTSPTKSEINHLARVAPFLGEA